MKVHGPPDTPGWAVVGGRSHADPVPGLPVDVWDLHWRSTGASIRVTDPVHHHQRSLHVVEAETDAETARFAVDEVSSGVFLFAVPLADWSERP
jgi:hypothetical protein